MSPHKPINGVCPVARIRVGKRHRKQLRGIERLAANISEVGLLQPVVIDSRRRLIAGGRRLAAVKLLGWDEVKVNVIDLEHPVLGEYSENAFRDPFLPSELAAIAGEVRRVEKLKARQRQLKGIKADPKEKGQTRDKVARFLGVSPKYLERAEYVVRIAEEFPDAAPILETLDKPKGVAKAYAEAKRFALLKRLGNTPTDPSLKLRHADFRKVKWEANSLDLIVTDPPWRDVDLYEDIARVAAHALKPGKLALVYTGPLKLPQVIANLSRHLRYVWQFVVPYSGEHLSVINGVFRRYCPVLVFSKGTPEKFTCYDTFGVTSHSKEWHEWEQDVGPVSYWLSRLTVPGDLIGDFCFGSGTVAVAAKQLGRRFVGCDVSRECVKLARRRVWGTMVGTIGGNTGDGHSKVS